MTISLPTAREALSTVFDIIRDEMATRMLVLAETNTDPDVDYYDEADFEIAEPEIYARFVANYKTIYEPLEKIVDDLDSD